MHVDNINISNDEIKYAERILLREGQFFGNDRRRFIRDFTTLDLHAVPGSGKTTLLLAKLLILEKKLPLDNNKGVLVISHTNTAVDEIKHRIEKYCPKLFSFPNFVGTIQIFVNQFLALPYYESIYKKKVLYIDGDIYNKEVEKYYRSLREYNKLKGYLSRKHDPIGILKEVRFDEDEKLKYKMNGSSKDFFLKDPKSDSYKEIERMKKYFFDCGILHYDDAYFLAQRYINEYPQIKNIIQSRFKYIFVDEMQDMALYQNELLESLFYDSGNSISYFQRIGDNNQSIYNSNFSDKNIWISRDKVLQISGSNRLTKYNARLVSRFALDESKIIGLNKSIPAYKPVLFIFKDNNCECILIQKFAEYLSSLLSREDFEKTSPVAKAIAWRKNGKTDKQIALDSYCPKYLKNNKQNLIIEEINDFNKIKLENKEFGLIRDEILDFIVKVLRIENILIKDEMPTKTRFMVYLKESHLDEYYDMNRKIYRWCKLIFSDNHAIMVKEFRGYIPILLKIFEKEINLSGKMLTDTKEYQDINEDTIFEKYNCERCKVGESTMEICSVHSVKGETHDATLFLESYYNKKYESDILFEILNGASISELIEKKLKVIEDLEQEVLKLNGKRGTKTRQDEIEKCQRDIKRMKEYSKLIFVALSRAKGVVAYGISHERYKKYLENKIVKDEWIIKEVF